MIRFIKFFQILSIIAFLGVLLFVYAFLPQEVGLALGGNGDFEVATSREVFFYSTLFLFVLANVLFVSLGRALKALPAPQPAPQTYTFYNPQSKQAFMGWIRSFSIVINAAFIFTLIYIGMLNNTESVSRDFNFLFYIGPVLVLIWLLLFLFIIFKRYKN